jgi:hypothetical protein
MTVGTCLFDIVLPSTIVPTDACSSHATDLCHRGSSVYVHKPNGFDVSDLFLKINNFGMTSEKMVKFYFVVSVHIMKASTGRTIQLTRANTRKDNNRYITETHTMCITHHMCM